MTDGDRARIEALVGTYFQVSRAYGRVARLPEGKTGMEALRECGGQRCDDEKWLQAMGEARCGEYYMRVYGSNSLVVTLTPEEFMYYRKCGGDTYSFSMRNADYETDNQRRQG